MPFNVFHQTFMTNEIVFYFTKNFYLVEKFNEKIQGLKSGGIIEYQRSKYLKKQFLKRTSTISSLNLNQLKGVFQIFLIGLLISSLSLIIEIVLNAWRTLIRPRRHTLNCRQNSQNSRYEYKDRSSSPQLISECHPK
jgi:hypothetical protein